MSVPRVKITYQDYLQLPEGQRYEVLEGDLRMVPAPGTLHQQVLINLLYAVRTFTKQHSLGRVFLAPVDVILDEESVVQPDLLVVLSPNVSRIKAEGVRGAPDLVVEVLSPGTAHRDRGIKRRLYARYGVQEYWLIDPQERSVEVACLKDGILETVDIVPSGASFHSPLLQGFALAVDDLFQE